MGGDELSRAARAAPAGDVAARRAQREATRAARSALTAAMEAIPRAQRPAALAAARAAAGKAVALDPGLAEGYVAQSLLAPRGRWNERLRLLEDAARRDPDNEVAHTFLQVLLSDAGRIRESEAESERAAAIDPMQVDFAVPVIPEAA